MAVSFQLSRAQLELQELVRSVTDERVRPAASERNKNSTWDNDLYELLGAYGFPGILVPKQYGGQGLGPIEFVIVVEEISRADAGLAASINMAQQTIAALLEFGSESQRERYLPGLANGTIRSITAITESSAGSKLSGMSTRAERDGEHWILSGTKSEVHIPDFADLAFVVAQTEHGLSVFLAETQVDGFEVREFRETVGLRSLPMYKVHFEQCRLPPESLMGLPGGAMKVFFHSFGLSRCGNAAMEIGLAEGALAEAIEYASQRSVGDRFATDFQGNRWRYSDLKTRLNAARLLTYQAAQMYSEGADVSMESAMAKVLACETAMDATTWALQLTGSFGCFSDHPFSRYMADAKVTSVGGGSLEVLKDTIARGLLGRPSV